MAAPWQAPPVENLIDYEKYETPLQPNLRQQEKIIACFERDDARLLRTSEVSVSRAEAQSFYGKLAKNRISPERVSNFLKHIKSPVPYLEESSVYLYEDMSGYENFRHIQAFISVGNSAALERGRVDKNAFHNRENVDFEDLEGFLEKYPEPSAFEKKIQPLLDLIESENGFRKRLAYEDSLRVFMRMTYGKRYEYWEQYKMLQKEAENGYSGEKFDSESEDTRREKPPITMSLISEGSVPRTPLKEQSIAPAVARKAEIERDAEDNKRMFLLKQMMRSMGKVPLVIANETELRFYSIPVKPDISDEESYGILVSLAREYARANSIDSAGDLEKALRKIVNPSDLEESSNDSKESKPVSQEEFDTKNSIFRLLIEHLKDVKYFEQLRRESLKQES